VNSFVRNLLASGPYKAPEAWCLDRLLTGYMVEVPYQLSTGVWIDIAVWRFQALPPTLPQALRHWWVLVVSGIERYGVVLYPFSDAEMAQRARDREDNDARLPPASIGSLCTSTSNENIVWGLWNVKVRAVVRLSKS
jgi:hypothetical protein